MDWAQILQGIVSVSVLAIAAAMIKVWTRQHLLRQEVAYLRKALFQRRKSESSTTTLLSNQFNMAISQQMTTVGKLSDQVNEHAEHQAVFQQQLLQLREMDAKQDTEIGRVRDSTHALRNQINQEVYPVIHKIDVLKEIKEIFKAKDAG